MIRNYQKNAGLDINLTPIYQSISGLKNNIEDLESLTSLSSLTDLSVDISNLSTWLSTLNSSFDSFTDGYVSVLVPMIYSNSYSLGSLSSSVISLNYDVLSINSSLSNLSSSVLNLNSSLSHMSQSFGEALNNLTDLTSLRTLTSYGNEISNLNFNTSILNDSINDLKTLSSLSTLNGVFTAQSFNNQAFNTTLNLNSDMFFTGQFGLNSGSIDCSGGIWDLKELKQTFLGSITANSLSKLNMENFDLSYCDLSCGGRCCFDDCNLTQCAITGRHAKFDNGIVKKCWFDCRTLDFNDVMIFSDTITLANGGNITFYNVNFSSTTNFKFDLPNGSYHILFSNCSIDNYVVGSSYFSSMFIERFAAHLSYNAINNV